MLRPLLLPKSLDQNINLARYLKKAHSHWKSSICLGLRALCYSKRKKFKRKDKVKDDITETELVVILNYFQLEFWQEEDGCCCYTSVENKVYPGS